MEISYFLWLPEQGLSEMDYWGKPGVAHLCKSCISCDDLGRGRVRWTIGENLGLRSSDKGRRSDDYDLKWRFRVSA